MGDPPRGGTAMTPAQPGVAAASSANSGALTPIDMIHVGDSLIITFSDMAYNVPQMQDRVKEDGTITLLQNVTFTAAGKTRGELEKEIRKTYVPAYYKAMTVNVQFDAQHQFYTVNGEVKAAGRQVYLSRTTVLKAIGSAGYFTDFANKRDVQLIRSGQIFHINANKALKNPSLDLEVYPGDLINVPRRQWLW